MAKGAMVAFGTATTVVAKNAVQSFAEYEQLIGGVETLFGKSAKTVENLANRAYKTAGLSANQYMSTITSFSASLLQSLGGDTEEATKYANRAIVDMADNANKMGTSIDMIQNAYQGFAKANYTMLDNLKLGYGGTQEEMKRLISDAAKMTDIQKDLGVTVDASSMSFANVVNAISVMQESLGIAGATAAEASTTVEGSLNSMKAAWQNLITGIGNENANLTILLNEFLLSVETFAGNLIPVIGTVLSNILTLLVENGPAMLEQGVNNLNQFIVGLTTKMPEITQFMIDMVVAMAKAIVNSIPYIIAAAISFMGNLLATIITEAFNVGENFMNSIKKGALAHLGELVNNAKTWGKDMVQGFVDGILSKMRAALDAVKSLASNIRSYLHFSRPDTGPLRDYETWMPDFMAGLAKGISANKYKVIDEIRDLANNLSLSNMDFGTATIKANTEYGSNGVFGGTGGKTVSVVQNIYSQAQTAADLMEEAIYNQEKAVLLGV